MKSKWEIESDLVARITKKLDEMILGYRSLWATQEKSDYANGKICGFLEAKYVLEELIEA